MFHPAKVLEVLSHNSKDIESVDSSTQVVLEMWDENQFTLLVDEKIKSKIKENDIVLVDYSTISEKFPIPKYLVVKILKGKKGENVWNNYKEYHKKKKETPLNSQLPTISPQGYMG